LQNTSKASFNACMSNPHEHLSRTGGLILTTKKLSC
jgi:hypothetical protein